MVISLIVSPYPAHSAVKTGDACKSFGQVSTVNGFQYTCLKSGSKLVWGKGVKVATYDAAFAKAFLAQAKIEAAEILLNAKSTADQISSSPYCSTGNSRANASIGGDPSTGLKALVFENPGICDITVRASASFLCPDGKSLKISNSITSTGIFPLEAGERLLVSYNIQRYFPQVETECRLLTGYTTNTIIIDTYHQSPNVMTLSSKYGGEFNQAESTKKANQYLISEKKRADKILSDAKNPVMIAKAWKAAADKAAADKAEADALAVTCVVGGSCKVGNTGPGGGVVFYDAGIEQPWGRFLEFAPEGWYGSASDPRVKWCDNYTWSVNGPQGTSIGQGKPNTNLMLKNCTSGAAVAAAAYRGGAKDDWYLPSTVEMNELVKFVTRVDKDNPLPGVTKLKVIRGGFTEDGYWSSTDYPEKWGYAYGSMFRMQDTTIMSKFDNEFVRPIRAFSVADAMTKAQAATNKNCSPNPKCTVGSTGPGGGIVFYDAGSQQSWGRYLEFAPEGWAGTAKDPYNIWCDLNPTLLGNIVSYEMLTDSGANGSQIGKGKSNTDLIVSKCSRGAGVQARSYTGGGKLDWSLPSVDELNELCKYASNEPLGDIKMDCRGKNLQRGGFTDDYYWSSSERDERDVWMARVLCSCIASNLKSNLVRVRPVRAF